MEIHKYFPEKEYMVLKKGTVVYNPEELLNPLYVYYMLKGKICMRGISRSGVSRIYLIFSGERFVNHHPLVNQNLQHDYFNSKNRLLPLSAMTDCSVYRIHSDAFLKFYRSNKAFNEEITQQIERDFSMCLQNFITREQDSVSIRLCQSFIDFSCESNGVLYLDQDFTNSILAEYIGAHPVTVSKIIAQLISFKYIQKQGRRIILSQPDQLQRLIDMQGEVNY